MQYELLEEIKKYYESEQYLEILYACRQLSPSDEYYEQLMYYKAMSYYYLDMYKKSAETFQILHEKSPDNMDFFVSLIIILDKVHEYKKIIKLIEESGKEILEEYTLQIIYHDSYMDLINEYRDGHDFIEILESFDRYEEYCPDDDKMMEYKIRFFEEHHMYDEAIKEYDKLFALEEKQYSYLEINDKIKCQESKGLYYYKTGQLEKAYDSYSQAMRIYHKMDKKERKLITELWYSEILAKNLEKYKDNPEGFFKEFFTFNEDTKEAWLDKLSTIRIKRKNDVIEYCDNLLKSGNSPELLKFKAHTYHNPQEALDCIEKVLDIQKEDKEAIKDKLNYLYQLNRFDEARTFIKNTPEEYLDRESIFKIVRDRYLKKNSKIRQSKCNFKLFEISPRIHFLTRNIKKIEEKSGKKLS